MTYITTTAAADFLTSPKTRFLLGPFMQGERTMKEAAEALRPGAPLSTFHRRVKQMLELGLIEVVRQEVRGGHSVKLYRAVDDTFIVPQGETSSRDLEAYLDEGFKGAIGLVSRGMAKEMHGRAPHWGFKIYAAGESSVFQQLTPLNADGTVLTSLPEGHSFYGDYGLSLTSEDARAFRHELQALYDKYLALGKEEGKGHFLVVGFAPL
jgi:hypothetical protein